MLYDFSNVNMKVSKWKIEVYFGSTYISNLWQLLGFEISKSHNCKILLALEGLFYKILNY
jgi:hypothetical protein